MAAGVPMRLEVDLRGAPEPEVLPKIREMLFSEDLTVLMSDLPAALKELKQEFDIGEDKVSAAEVSFRRSIEIELDKEIRGLNRALLVRQNPSIKRKPAGTRSHVQLY